MPDVGNDPSAEHTSGATLEYAALSSGLTRYLESVEMFFPYAAAQLSLRQHAEHAAGADVYFEEELDSERAQLQDELLGVVPRAIRGSALVVLFSAFESTVMDFSKELSSELELPPFDPSSKKGTLLEKANRYYSDTCGVQLFSSPVEKRGIEILRRLRNSFVHKQSTFLALPEEIQASIIARKNRLTNCQVHGHFWVPNMGCVRAHGELVHTWAHSLCGRVVHRVGPEAYL